MRRKVTAKVKKGYLLIIQNTICYWYLLSDIKVATYVKTHRPLIIINLGHGVLPPPGVGTIPQMITVIYKVSAAEGSDYSWHYPGTCPRHSPLWLCGSFPVIRALSPRAGLSPNGTGVFLSMLIGWLIGTARIARLVKCLLLFMLCPVSLSLGAPDNGTFESKNTPQKAQETINNKTLSPLPFDWRQFLQHERHRNNKRRPIGVCVCCVHYQTGQQKSSQLAFCVSSLAGQIISNYQRDRWWGWWWLMCVAGDSCAWYGRYLIWSFSHV